MRAQYLALAAVSLLTACGGADPDAVLDTVRMTEQSQLAAIAAKDLRGSVRNYAPDAQVQGPGSAPLTGGEAIGEAFEQLLADPNLKIAIEPGPGWAAESGDLAVTTFTGTMTTTDPASGEPVTVPVANQTVWKRTDAGAWQIVSDQTTALPVAEPAPPATEG